MSPFALCAPRYFKLLTRLPQPGIVTLATNAPGPRHRLRLMGQRMERLLPIPPTALQLSTGVAVLSYGDELVFGITADYDAAPDFEQLAAGIELGMARLVALSQDSVLLFTVAASVGRARLPNSAARWRPSARPARASLTLRPRPTTVRRWVHAQVGAGHHRPAPPRRGAVRRGAAVHRRL